LNVLKRIKARKIEEVMSDPKIKAHIQKWSWITFDFFDTIAWDDDAYKSRIVDLIAEDKIDENIRKIESYVSKVSAKQDKICKELKFNDEELKILEATKKYGELKEYRKNYLLLVLYRIYILMKEIASRLNTDVKYLHFMLAKEFDTIFESYDENVPKERMKASILVSENGVSRVLLGQEYLQYLEKLPKTEVLENIQELKGMPAFVGKAKGTVKIINSAKDAGKMQKGDILVSIATFPDLVPAMKKAAAIVTDEGGITCHAAIVSRELGIPCVIGTKFATKALKDGDIVEVDAHKGTITKTAESTTNAADWFLMEEIPASSVFLLSGTFRRMTEEYRKDFNLPVHMDMLYKQNALYLYFQRKEFLANAKFLLDKTLASPKFLWDINVKNKKNQKNMFKFCDKLNKIDVTTLDDSSLLRLYSEFSLLFEKAIVSGWIDNVLEFENELFSNYLREYLNKKAALAGKTGAELFSIFTTPDKITNGIKQEIALQKIALAIKKSNKADFFISNSAEDIDVKLKKIDPKIDAMITSHAANFCWYFFMYEGPGWGRLEFIMALKEILKEGKELVIQTHKKEKQILIKKLGIDKKHQLLLKIASEIVFNKDLRKHSIYYSCYSSVSMFKEIARRLNISITESKTILPWEMEDVFANPSKFNLKTREDGFLMQFYDGNTTIYTGKTAIDFYDSVHKKNAVSLDVDAIKGSCAYPGTVQGTVRLVNSPSEISKIKEGDILVAHQTNPDILPAMKLADAFVTDLGGITCHAAIVSREMKKPCIVGTKVATKVLKDGMLVNVDADKGIVTIIDKPKNVQNDVKPDPGKKYSLANHAVDMNWANIETIWHGLLDPRIEKQVKAKFLDTFCEIIDGRTLNFYVESNELNDFVKSSAQSLISDKKLIAYLKKQTIITSEKIRDYAYHLISRINSMSDSQLSKALQEIKNLQTECVVYGTAVVFADFDGKISEASLNVLSNKKNVRCSVQDYYKALSSPEEKSLTEKAYAKIAKSKSSLKDLAKKFFWLDQGYIGRGITIDQIETIRKNAKLNQSEKNISGLSFCSITAIEKELSLSEEEKWLFKLARDIVVIKSLRADSRQFLNVVTNKIIDLIAKKLKIDSSLLECLYIEEIIEILNGKKQDMEMLQKRCKHFVFASGKDRKYSLILGDDELASFIELNVPEEKHEASSTISGKSAYSGIVRGKAKLVLSSVDISKVQNGDILVSAATSPQLISAMQKAAAFVTDVGGITSHAAIVAREMKKPCIIGTKFATTMLSDNDLIEVDADKGIVKVIEKNDASKKA
jgi:phosphohistidine swiveling domain-containing protein